MLFQDQNAYEIEERTAEAHYTALLPVGAVEAHGPHLPVGTDNLLAERMAGKVSEVTGALQLPTISYGQVWSLRHFPGSINISNETLIHMITDIGTSLYQQGFRILALINGHLGNNTALKQAARRLYDECPELKVYYFFYPGTKGAVDDVRETPSAHASYFHACELETSYMLYLAGEYVDMNKAINDPPVIPLEADVTPTPWESFTDTAVLGDATLATEEKGQRVIDTAIKEIIRLLKEAQQEAHLC